MIEFRLFYEYINDADLANVRACDRRIRQGRQNKLRILLVKAMVVAGWPSRKLNRSGLFNARKKIG